MIATFISGDVIAIEGEEYTVDGSGNKITLSEGWVIERIEVKTGSVDFEKSIMQLDNEISSSLMSSMAMITGTVMQGKTTLTAGANVNMNIVRIVKNARTTISEIFKFIFFDVIRLETGDEIDPKLIDISFSKIREEDAAQFLNLLTTMHNIGAATTNEVRANTDRIGLPLEPLPPEMTPEGKALLVIEELLEDEAFELPPSWSVPRGPVTQMEEEMDAVPNDQRD
jgi:hypothetical protein